MSGSLDIRATERPFLGMFLRLLSAVAITAMFALAKYLQGHGVHLAEVMFYRQLFAVPVTVAILAATSGLAPIATPHIGRHITRTAMGLIGMMFNFLSVMMLPLAESITFTFTAPIFATILSAVILREATGIHRWSAVLIGFLGVAVIAGPTGTDVPPLGLGVAICSALSVATVAILVRDLTRTEPPAVIVFWFSVLSLPPTGLCLLWFGHSHSPAIWGLLGLLGLLGGVGQYLLTAALRYGPVSLVMPMDYSSIIWASLLGWLLWGALPAPASLAGATLIIGSGLYIVWREQWLGRKISLSAKASGDNSA